MKTRFIDVPTLSKLVAHVGVKQFVSGMAVAIEEDFLRWNEFEKSARTANHTDVGVVELMPISDSKQFGFKYVNGHPSNTDLGLSTVMAFGALSTMDTGFPLLLSELTLTTAFRTAATSAMAAKALCRPNSKKMAMIGCGAQSEFQIIAFHELIGINEINIYDVDDMAMAKLERNLLSYGAIKVNKASSTEDAVKGVDIISTATADKRWATILKPEMIEPGMHINAIGGDCPGKTELDADVLRKGKIFVEYEPQTRIEGDIQQLPEDYPVTGLWEVLSKKKVGRDNEEQVTIFDSVGFALEDYSSLRYLYELSGKTGFGKDIELVPNLSDPKDLYELIQSGSNTAFARKVS
jgi:ornithine cyclodeaminase